MPKTAKKIDFDVLNKGKPEVVEQLTKEPPAPAKKDPFDLDRLKLEIVPFKKKVDEMVKTAKDHKITDQASNEKAVVMGTQAKTLFKQIEAARKKVIGPYDLVVRGINSIVKEFKDALGILEKDLKGKIGKYHKEQAELARRIAEKKAKEQAEEKRKEAEAKRKADLERQEKERAEALARQEELNKEAEAAGVEPVKVEIPEIVDPGVEPIVEETIIKNKPIQTETGTSSFVQKWTYKVLDLEKVPDDYIVIIKKVDDKKVKAAIEAGIHKIEGLDIFEDIDVRFRTK